MSDVPFHFRDITTDIGESAQSFSPMDDSSLSYEDAPTDSRTEPPMVGSLDDDGSFHALWYQLGKSLFDCWVAESIFCSVETPMLSANVDAKLQTALRTFPISLALDRMANLESPHAKINFKRDSSNQFAELMTRIGAVVHHGEIDAKKHLAILVQSCLPSGVAGAYHWQRHTIMIPSPPASASETEELATPHGSPGRIAVQPASAYTSALKEWSEQDQERRTVEWVDNGKKIGSGGCMHWEQMVLVNGRPFKASAQKKQDAKNLASKKACEQLRINV